MKPSLTTIDEYIQQFDPAVRKILESVRQAIREESPDAVEGFGYGMPAFKLNGKPLAYFAAWKEHLGFYPTPSGTEQFKDELSRYKHAKGSVQFPIDEPMPIDLIRRIVRFRRDEIQKKAGK